MDDEKKAELAIVPPAPPTEEHGPSMAPEAVAKLKAAEQAKLQRRLTETAKAGLIDALKRVQSQIAHMTDLNFQAIRGLSVQKHPDGSGKEIAIYVDVIPTVAQDGPVQVNR